MTGWLIVAFFGAALLIGVYFTWVLLRSEMDGRPKPPPVDDDFGFAPEPVPPKVKERTLRRSLTRHT